MRVSQLAWPRPLLAGAGLLAVMGIAFVALNALQASTAGTSPSAQAPQTAAPQTNEEGQVTVKVTWQGSTDQLTFAIVMDTHAVDLDGYDLKQLAVLRTDRGQEIRPDGWDAPAGGHHRSGKLTFPTVVPNGNVVIGPETQAIELVIREVAGVPERVFRWEL